MHPLCLFKQYLKHILKEFRKGTNGQENKEVTERYEKSSETGSQFIEDGQETRQESRQSEETNEAKRLLTLE